MRLFVAVTLPDGVRRAVADLLDECRARAAQLAPGARITWAVPDRLHLTVRFIGSADDDRANAIRAALTPPLAVEAFVCTLAGTGTFPSHGRPRVVWAGVTAGRDRLLALEREISLRLASAGVLAEERPYNPHVTLARVRDADGLRGALLLDGLGTAELGTVPVRSATLFESRLSPRGSAYLPLLATALGGGVEDGA